MALSPLASVAPSEALRLVVRRVDMNLVQDLMLGMHSHAELVPLVSDTPEDAVMEWEHILGKGGLDSLLHTKARYGNLDKVSTTKEKENIAKKIGFELTGAFWATLDMECTYENRYLAVLLLICGLPVEQVREWCYEEYDLSNAVSLFAAGVTGLQLERCVAGGVDLQLLNSVQSG